MEPVLCSSVTSNRLYAFSSFFLVEYRFYSSSLIFVLFFNVSAILTVFETLKTIDFQKGEIPTFSKMRLEL